MFLPGSPRGEQVISGTGTPQRKEPGREQTTETTRQMQKDGSTASSWECCSENPIAFQIKPHDGAKCVRQTQENGAYFWRFRPGYFMYVVPGYEEAWNFGRYPDNPSGRCDLRARSIVAVYEHCEFPILTGTHNFLRRELKHTDGACRDMLVKLISFFSAKRHIHVPRYC